MRLIKKIMAVTAAGILSAAMLVTANAASVTDLILRTEEPDYTITVPENIEVAAKGTTDVEITASDVQNLPVDGKISVSLAEGSVSGGDLYLTAEDAEMLKLEVTGAGGTAAGDTAGQKSVGMELASFTGNGSKSYQLSLADGMTPENGVSYQGYIVYGIEVISEAES